MPPSAPQRISRIRREYNGWVGNETLEDYALRFAPRSFRKWSEARVAITAMGSVSFLALEAIGASIYINYGFSNALYAILVVAAIVFLTGLPISYYAARYNVDVDLLARGAGFGYVGSTITSLIYASFTFIFFALEAAIMAVALKLVCGLPLWLAYILSSLIVIPLVTHGVTFISRLQYLTLVPWLIMMLVPYAFLLWRDPDLWQNWQTYQGLQSSTHEFQVLAFGYAATVSFSLVAQIGEQVDFLRFLPERKQTNRRRWWGAVLVAGPGWIVLGALKQLGGALLAFVALQQQFLPDHAGDPTQMYLLAYGSLFSDPRVALGVTGLFVILSQIKINVTNAYAGSLAWSNFFSRLTHSHPGRVVWLVFNVAIALLLMQLGLIGALERVLGLYACVALSWVGALVADLVVNKPLGLSPPGIEFRRAYLHNFNPVGVVATLLAVVLSVSAYIGLLGLVLQAYAPFLALVSAFTTAPMIAWLTGGRYYIARSAFAHQNGKSESCACCICDHSFEREDTADCPAYGGTICSLCCTLDARCADLCKKPSASDIPAGATRPVVGPPQALSRGRLLNYCLIFFLLAGTLTGIIVLTQHQVLQSLGRQGEWSLPNGSDPLLFVLWMSLLLATGIGAWWLILTRESRIVAQEESNRQTQLLLQEIEEHRKTDTELIKAKQLAEAANVAKSRFLTGMSHELRSPLNSILGYAQLLKTDQQQLVQKTEALDVILQSSEHLLTLIDDILDLARIEAGKFRLNPRDIDLQIFLRQLVQVFKTQAENKGLRFETAFDGRLPSHVRVDERRLRQILINLLSNAVKYTEQGFVRLSLVYSGNSVTVRVTDSGSGIAPPDLERIFQPFQRLTRHDLPRVDGTGLGLPICKLLIHQMGGELTVETELNVGSTFQVRMFLPGANGIVLPPTAVHVTGYRDPRRRILITDDQREHRMVVAAMLSRLGFVVFQAAFGLECLTRTDEHQPDLILLDLVMPKLDGFEVARLLRNRHQYAGPIIAVSADAFEEHRELSLAAGCNDFIAKPLQLPSLLGVLQLHLNLTWIESSPKATPLLPHPTTHSYPPANFIESLYESARVGYVKGVHQTAVRLQQEAPEHETFAREVIALAREFRLAELMDLLEQSRQGERLRG